MGVIDSIGKDDDGPVEKRDLKTYGNETRDSFHGPVSSFPLDENDSFLGDRRSGTVRELEVLGQNGVSGGTP